MSIIERLKGKSVIDLFWSFSDNVLQQLINFIVGIILARLLMPEEFGLVGIVTVFITLSSVFVDGGFSAALINKKDVNDLDYNTVFFSNIGISFCLYSIIFLLAEKIALFFNNLELVGLLRLSAINVVLISFSAIHRTIIVRNLNFKLITLVSFVAVTVSAIIAVYMAYSGYGVYSLVYRTLIGQIITIVLFWILNKWRPSFKFSKESFKELFSYGGNLLLSNILNVLHSNVYYIVIGKFFNPSQLGFYTRANTFRDLASTNISNTIKRVSFSTLSRIECSDIQYNRYLYFRNITYLLISFCMLFLFLAANNIVLILLSEKWLESIYILKILSMTGVFLALYNLNIDYLAVIKETRVYLLIEIIGKLLVVPVIVIGVVFNFEYFLIAILFHNIVTYFIVVFFLNTKYKGFFKNQMFLIYKYLIIFLIVFLISEFFNLDNYGNWVSMIIKFLIVIVLYLFANIGMIKSLVK